VGVPFQVTNWILACVSSANFSILINGSPSYSFKDGRGIRQGFPLSPILFLMVIEGLSLLIKKATVNGKFLGLKICVDLFLTHLLFVDGILIWC
jgi:hypothetical protein